MRTLVAIAAVAGGILLAGGQQAGGQRKDPSQNIQLIESLKGPVLYQSYCAVCHGKDARGNGPMANTLTTAPPDLTRLAARRGGVFPIAEVRRIIAGEQQAGASHGTREMPVWGPIFSQIAWDRDFGPVRLDNLARYLKEIQAK